MTLKMIIILYKKILFLLVFIIYLFTIGIKISTLLSFGLIFYNKKK